MRWKALTESYYRILYLSLNTHRNFPTSSRCFPTTGMPWECQNSVHAMKNVYGG